MEITPRIIRLRDAPDYLGMNKNYFNAAVRPCLTEIPIGDKGVGFDRLELDMWVAYTKDSSGRPAQRRILWDANNKAESPAYAGDMVAGTLKSKSMDSQFMKALEQAICRKRKGT